MGRRKTFKQFHKTYDAYLLRTPHANNSLADFAEIEKRFWLDVENESIIDELYDGDTWREYQDYLENVEMIEAESPL